jgi:hypothetical protein
MESVEKGAGFIVWQVSMVDKMKTLKLFKYGERLVFCLKHYFL